MYGFGNYSVAVYAVGYDGVIESSSPLVTKLIDIYCQGRPAGTTRGARDCTMGDMIMMHCLISMGTDSYELASGSERVVTTHIHR